MPKQATKLRMTSLSRLETKLPILRYLMTHGLRALRLIYIGFHGDVQAISLIPPSREVARLVDGLFVDDGGVSITCGGTHGPRNLVPLGSPSATNTESAIKEHGHQHMLGPLQRYMPRFSDILIESTLSTRRSAFQAIES